jgi:hypothetical protein
MGKVYEKYPDNHEVAVVYAVALFMLEERRGYRDNADPDLIRLHGVLTGVLEQNIAHPGACHLYIHATESSQTPDRALHCAEHLSDAVPVASHIQHMPSHTWNEVGHWGKSVRANTLARHSDLKARENKGFSYGDRHNLHMLLFAASYDGQGAAATQAGKDYRKVTDRFDEVVEKDNRPEDEVGAALWDFAYGYASLKEGDLATAERMRDTTLEFAATTDKHFRFHPAGRVVGTVAHILEGEILWMQNDLDGGRTGTAAVCGTPLARRRAHGSRPACRCGERVSRRTRGPPARRLVITWPEGSFGGTRHIRPGGRRGLRDEHRQGRCVDYIVAVLVASTLEA